MIAFEKYSEIQEFKKAGLNRNKTAQMTNLNFATVKKYWDMSPEDYWRADSRLRHNHPLSQYWKYESAIKEILQKYPYITASKIYSRLEEASDNKEVSISRRTMRNYVKRAKRELGMEIEGEPSED